jgi:hypothetical protein
LTDYLSLANLLTGITLIASAVGPLLLSFKIGSKIPRIRNLTLLLCAFLVLHGSHHLVWFLGYVWLSHEILEPASVVAMIVFALYLYNTTIPSGATKKENQGQSKFPSPSPTYSDAAATGPALAALLVSIPLNVGPDVTAIALFVSFAIFVFTFYRYPSIRSLHFQFAVFLSIWSVSEVVYSFQQLGLNSSLLNPYFGAYFHFASMAALGVFVNYRFFSIARGMRPLGVRKQIRGGEKEEAKMR